MTIHLDTSHHVLAMSAAAAPALRIESPALVELDTADCFGDQIRSFADVERGVDWSQINPATGPVYIEGARPGDVLVVHVERIEIAAQGVMCTGGGFGTLADRIPDLHWRFLPVDEGVAHWSDEVSIRIEPMIGVIGVAPAGDPIPCGTPGSHGGNMDTRLITEGATVYLPVQVPGALLAAGDLHAAMGDGEVAVTGVEVSGRVTLHVDVRDDLPLRDPLVETRELVATIASAETLDEAADAATHHMAALLNERLGIALPDAVMLMSAVGDLQVSQVVDPLKTARFVMPKAIYEPVWGPLL